MATQQSSDSSHATNLQVIRLLTTAVKADTAYRDLYLHRAAARFSALLSRTEYEQLRGQDATVEHLLAQTRRAVDRQDWTQVQELTARATGFRHLLETKRSEMEFAKEIYNAADVAIDPLSPGFDTVFAAGGRGTAGVREELNATLISLVQADPEWSDFYAQRQAYFARLSFLPEAHMQQVAGGSPNELQEHMQQAAEKGNL